MSIKLTGETRYYDFDVRDGFCNKFVIIILFSHASKDQAFKNKVKLLE